MDDALKSLCLRLQAEIMEARSAYRARITELEEIVKREQARIAELETENLDLNESLYWYRLGRLGE